MVIIHLPNDPHGQRKSIATHRLAGNNIRGTLFSKHRKITYFIAAGLFVVQLYFQHAWIFPGNDDDIIVAEMSMPSVSDNGRRTTTTPNDSPCPPVIDLLESLSDGLVCINKCIPASNNTLEGMGLDPYEQVKIKMPENLHGNLITEHGKYRIHFPEENIDLNLTGRLANLEEFIRGDEEVLDTGHLHPRAITERLLRRIVAKLLRAGVLDPSKNIINTGSWIGDNALPWALMMETLRPNNPGKVIAIDPSENFIKDMVDLANVNSIGNMCAQIGILSSNMTQVHLPSDSTEHIKVYNEQQVVNGPAKRRVRFQSMGTWKNAITVDSLNLQSSISLLHIDVEGHEGELLEGARATIQSSRPIIITEGYNVWDPIPVDENDKHVLATLTKQLHYVSGDTIPEYCGAKKNARNRIWWPDVETRDAAMAVVGKDLERKELVPWIAVDLPELG